MMWGRKISDILNLPIQEDNPSNPRSFIRKANPKPPSIASPSPSGKIQDPLNPNANGDKHFDVNVVMILIVLICALLISLGLNYFIRCALGCSYLNGNSSNRGIEKRALKTFPAENYSLEKSKLPGLDTQCVICISEFVLGDRVPNLAQVQPWISCEVH
uniref:RING-type E3 ubiquitin transferase n=1 Tax=Salix viminalis TaxID=40686 RepID=A0A6N2M9G5_SALVM